MITCCLLWITSAGPGGAGSIVIKQIKIACQIPQPVFVFWNIYFSSLPLWFLDLVSGWNNLKNQITLLPKAWPQKGAKVSPACCPWLSGRTDPHSMPMLHLLAALRVLPWPSCCSGLTSLCRVSPSWVAHQGTHCAFHVDSGHFAAKPITVRMLSLLTCVLKRHFGQHNQ